jgi:EpsI family protein
MGNNLYRLNRRMPMQAGLRLLVSGAMIVGTALVLQARGYNEVFPPRLPLQSFPAHLGPWVATDIPMDREVLDALGPGDFLLRVYKQRNDNQPPVDLFIAYFPSQRTGDTIHSPKHCLPGTGWLPVESTRIRISLPRHAPFPANRYVISRGNPVSWFSTGIGRTIVEWRANTGQRSIWLPMLCD